MIDPSAEIVTLPCEFCSGCAMNQDPDMIAVLRFVEARLAARAIAAQLGCGLDDVRHSLADATRALSARSVPDAVEVAIRRGLIESSAAWGRPA